MKRIIRNIKDSKLAAQYLLIVALSFLTITCQKDVIEWVPDSDQLVITDYVYSQSEQFSEFGAVLAYTGIENLLRVRGPFTLLLPTDEAMRAYYSRMGVSSYTELDMQSLQDLVYNHIFKGQISEANIGRGALPYKNGLGDFVASDFKESEILINKSAIIIKRDIQTANGIVQHIDYVLEPVVDNIFDVLSSYEGYSIFLEGIRRTGIEDTLKVLSFPYGNTTARTRYSLLAVPDTLYNREGIYSIDDLIARYGSGGDVSNKDNDFYKYMEYHCLSGTHYFSNFAPTDIYYLISYDNYLSITVEKDFQINKTDSSYTGFYYDLSNIPAKNGVIHTIDSPLPNTETDLAEVTFQTTDFFDLQQGPYYLDYYQSFYDGQNTFEYIKWDGEYMMYYLKTGHFLMDDDCLKMEGHFWIEITTPKIRKGKYELSTFMFFGGFAVTACYLDGKYLGQIDPNEGTWGGPPLVIGEVNFEETEEHTIRLESVVPGGLFWDYVRFTPL